MKRFLMNPSLLIIIFLMAILFGTVSEIFAGGHGRSGPKTYEIEHNFRLPVAYAGGVKTTPEVVAATNGATVATNPNVSVADSFNIKELISTTGGPFGGFPNSWAYSLANSSEAEAEAGGNVDPFRAGVNAITGSYYVKGYADANPVVPGSASANSRTEIRATGKSTLRNGAVRFGPKKMTGISAGVKQRSRDPLSLVVQDPDTSEILYSGDLFDVTFDLVDGEFSWENDIFFIDAWEGDFSINIPGLLTLEEGAIDISMQDGAVSSVTASGIFSDLLLPTIGEIEAFTINLQNIFDLTLNLPMLDPEIEYDFDWKMTSSGEATDELTAVPLPGCVVLCIAGLGGLFGLRKVEPVWENWTGV